MRRVPLCDWAELISSVIWRFIGYWLEKALRDAEANGELAGKGNPTGANQYSSGNHLKESNSKKPSRSDFVSSYREGADLAKMGVATPEQFEQCQQHCHCLMKPPVKHRKYRGYSLGEYPSTVRKIRIVAPQS